MVDQRAALRRWRSLARAAARPRSLPLQSRRNRSRVAPGSLQEPARAPERGRPNPTWRPEGGRRDQPAPEAKSAGPLCSSRRNRILQDSQAQPRHAPVQVCLHGAQRSAGLCRDLSKGEVREEAQQHGLTVRLVEAADRGAHGCRPFAGEGDRGRVAVRGSNGRPNEALISLALRRYGAGAEPSHLPTLACATKGNAESDPGQPRAKWAFTSPAG